MAGGVMSQVQGIIPGMRREEEVPDPAQPQEEYQEYQVMLGRQIHPLIQTFLRYLKDMTKTENSMVLQNLILNNFAFNKLC